MAGVSLSISLVIHSLSTITLGLWFQDALHPLEIDDKSDLTVRETLTAMSDRLLASGVTALISLFGTMVATAMLTMVVSRAVLGRKASAREAWRDARPRLAPLGGLLVLMPVLAAGVLSVGMLPGTVLLAAGAPAAGDSLIALGLLVAVGVTIWGWGLFSLAPPALMLEKQDVTQAVRRSVKLVRGSWWRVLGIQLLAMLLLFIVANVLELPADLIARAVTSGAADMTADETPTGWTYLVITGVGAVLASTLTLPISAGVTALLYLDQRIRRESLDLQLARAAKVPGFTAANDTGTER